MAALMQVPHDQPLVAQAMMESWVHSAMKANGRAATA